MSNTTTNTANNPNEEGTKQLFNNALLEKLTRTHVAVPISILSGASVFILYWGYVEVQISALLLVGMFLTGFIGFTFIEYLIHKYVFHMLPSNDFKKDLQYKLHGIHHDYPKDKDRLAMPPWLSALLAVVFFFMFKFIMGNYVYGFLPGLISGYTSYLFVHYIVHAWQPPNNFFKILWIHHSIHHYKDPERAYGVSSPLWDLILGTMPKRKRK